MGKARRCDECGTEIPRDAPEGLCPKCLLNLGQGDELAAENAPGPSPQDADRNLLFGVLAVQLRKVTPTQLVDVAGAWATDPSRDLPQRMVEAGILSERDCELLARFVEDAVEAHGGDSSNTLASFGGEEEVYRSFRGSLVREASGKVSPAKPVIAQDLASEDVVGVEEAPGRYSQIREYARGGMGRVLLVHDQHLGRDIALKELLPPSEHEGEGPSPIRHTMAFLGRFLQEAKITSQLEHPSIVPVYELGHRKDGTLYYTMKLVRGRTLADALREAKTYKERLALLPHFVDLCQAIAYAHERGVIHRDIKPSNIMVCTVKQIGV